VILFLRRHGMLHQQNRSNEQERGSKPETSARHGGFYLSKIGRDRATDRACLS